MMWDTVKWFTPILIALFGGWIKYFTDEFIAQNNSYAGWVLIALSVIGLFLSIICIYLLRSFYKSNLIYITMFAKVEEELGFETRKNAPFDYYPGDEHIT